jgi:ketohexokinase
MHILGIGVATLDLIFTLQEFPREDEEIRAVDLRVARGGNVTNTLAVLTQFGHRCDWAGVLADEPRSEIIRADLDRHGVSFEATAVVAPGQAPTSCVLLGAASGSRTIIHHRKLREFDDRDFMRIDVRPYDWVHFEGRNADATEAMLLRVRAEAPGAICSLEAEKSRPRIERLFSLADVLLFSRAFAAKMGYTDARSFLRAARTLAPRAALFCGWGFEGAYALAPEGEECFSPAAPPPVIRDTLGAGDVFNAGIIDALARRQSVMTALSAATLLAGRKCAQPGFDGLADPGG